VPLLAALGFGAVFGAAANAPLACSIMICEIFGWHLLPLALPCCYLAFLCTGRRGLYRAQRHHRSKREVLIFWKNKFR
jgi:H+/Cl- antiporter ClcA